MSAMEHPKLVAVAQITGEGFAELPDRRLAKLKEIEQAKVIEHRPQQQIEAKAPLAHTPERRFRRI
jgi:hypothetical protein